MLITIRTWQIQKWTPVPNKNGYSYFLLIFIFSIFLYFICCTVEIGLCLCVRLTDNWAALAVSREQVGEDGQEHGKAEHQSNLKRVAFTTLHWQSTAYYISHHDQISGQE
ncbi:hypothetical protein XENORESO_001719 [Xenotaenia resolanae]|uniref:Uncharacterized protein n=1 Tax=Xenotaenia resolanae TaxID=208358 RepID=A0ABV0WI94_9TELE